MRLTLDDVELLLKRGYAVVALALRHGDDTYSLTADGEIVVRVYPLPVAGAFGSEIVARDVRTIAEAHAAILVRIAELDAVRSMPPPTCSSSPAARGAACAIGLEAGQ